MSCSYVLYVVIAKYVPFQRHFYDNSKRLLFLKLIEFRQYQQLIAIVESEMSLHAGQEKRLLRGQIIIAKVTLERAHCLEEHVCTMNMK